MPGNNYKDLETHSIVRNQSAIQGRIIWNYLDFEYTLILFFSLKKSTFIFLKGSYIELDTTFFIILKGISIKPCL